MRTLILTLLLGATSSCTTTNHIQRFKIFEYGAFGPQAMAHELIGMNWWQWSEPGGFEPSDTFDIQVIVYCDGQRSDIEKQFPVDKEIHKDYRYVTKNDAIDYLTKHINEDFIPEVTEELKATKYKIESTISCSQ